MSPLLGGDLQRASDVVSARDSTKILIMTRGSVVDAIFVWWATEGSDLDRGVNM